MKTIALLLNYSFKSAPVPWILSSSSTELVAVLLNGPQS